jgi:hypothetical protein
MYYGGGGWGYGVVTSGSSTNCLIENNIFRYLRHAMIAGGGSNCNVWTFNYSREQYSTWWLGIGYDDRDLDLHAKYPYGHLFEHNIVERIASNDYHGDNGPYNTFIRNMATGGIALIKTMHEWATLGNMEKQGDLLYPLRFNWTGDAVPATDLYGFLNNYTTPVPHNVAYDFGAYSSYRLDDVSYYYSSKPEFLDGYSYPAIGPKTRTGGDLSFSIPAKGRYNGSGVKTYLKNPTPKPFTTSGALSYDQTWFGIVALTGHVTVPNGVTLTINSGATVNYNGYSLTSTGGTISIQSGGIITLNPASYFDISGTGSTYEVNGINVGASFNGIGQSIKAIPPSGYGVAGWSDGVGGNYRKINGNVTVNAKLKALHKSNTIAAWDNTSQRKLIQTLAGGNPRWLHQVYTSAGHVWLEHSSDGGSTWVLGNNGQPLDGTAGGKCPSIAFTTHYTGSTTDNYIGIVWQEK